MTPALNGKLFFVFSIHILLGLSVLISSEPGVSESSGSVDATSQTNKYVLQRNESDLSFNLTGPSKLGGHRLAMSFAGSEPIAIRRISKNVFDDKSYPAGRFAIQVDGQSLGYFTPGLNAFLSGKQTPIEGRIYLLHRDNSSVQARKFHGAQITEIRFPSLDAGGSENIYYTIELQNASLAPIRRKSAGKNTAGKSNKWRANNFRVELGSLPCEKVTKIDSFTIKQNIVEGGTKKPKYEDITLEIGMGMGRYKAWKAMSNKPASEQKKLLRGNLVIQSKDGTKKAAHLKLSRAHIVSLQRGENSFKARLSVDNVMLKPL